MSARTVPYEPLRRYLTALSPGPTPGTEWTQVNIGRLCGVSKQAVHQWKARGINPWTADVIAVRLKTLPWIIWGDVWEAACIADEEYRAASVARTINNPWHWPAGYHVTDPEEIAA